MKRIDNGFTVEYVNETPAPKAPPVITYTYQYIHKESLLVKILDKAVSWDKVKRNATSSLFK